MGKDIRLFNGTKMPIVGLGTWQATNPEELAIALNEALTAGYRHFDTAYVYQNEMVIGSVLKQWLDSGKIKREDLYIVTKLPPNGMRKDLVGHFLELQLKMLQLDYIDLYLLHTPVGFHYIDDMTVFPMNEEGLLYDYQTNLAEIWKAMEEQVDKGLTKSIGLSNFSCEQVERLMKVARIQPANHQVELNAYCQKKEMVDTCKKHNISICAYAPFGSPGSKETLKQMTGSDWEPVPVLQDPVVTSIAKAHGKSNAQVLLRFLIQQGIAVIPKSLSVERIKSNFDVFDFTLTNAEMVKLKALDKGAAGAKFDMKNLWKGVTAHPECPK